MILKVQEIKGNGGWKFFDGVDSVEISFRIENDPNGKPYNYKDIRLLKDKLAFNIVSVNEGQETYLLTNEGKTIERIN